MKKESISPYLGKLKAENLSRVGIGVVSKNAVDAAIEMAYAKNLSFMLIASRRQVETESFGGGYVNNWSTESFVDYVAGRDPENRMILCRDHGGPWQHPSECHPDTSEYQVVKSALDSFKADIDAGFSFLHIDTSFDSHGNEEDIRKQVKRLLYLYEECMKHAEKNKKTVEFEFGGEDSTGSKIDVSAFEAFSNAVAWGLEGLDLPLPLYMVGPTGSKVKEDRNVGILNQTSTERKAVEKIEKIVKRCEELGVLLKAHNCDYLSSHVLSLLNRAGVGMANVAPEFGVVETRALLNLFSLYGLEKQREAFLKLAFDSRKWEKWMVDKTQATDEDRAIIAGHYVFSSPHAIELKAELDVEMESKGEELDEKLKEEIKTSILRYSSIFQPIRTSGPESRMKAA